MGEPDYSRAKIILSVAALAFIAIVIFLFLHWPAKPGYKIIFFNVGQGDSALIHFPNGAKMLVDCGPDRTILNKLGRYLPFYDREIEYLLISHPDLDHYGGCTDVLKRYKVNNIITNGEEKSGDSYWLVWKKYMDAEGAQTKVISAPVEMGIAGARLEFFSPNPLVVLPGNAEGNNSSIVFRLTYGTTTVFFTGDMEAVLEKELVSLFCEFSSIKPMPCPALHSGFLKVGHHGSDSSSDDSFLVSVNPDTAVISVGKNRYGHPSLRVLKKLERVGAQIWRTNELNDIIVR